MKSFASRNECYCCCLVVKSGQTLATPWTAVFQASLSLTISWSFPSSYPLHQWYHPAISSSDALFSLCPQSSPALGTFPMSLLFTSGDQNTGASASASVFPISFQSGFAFKLTGLISLLSRSLLQHHSLKASVLWHCAFFTVQFPSHEWPLGRP